MTPALTSAPSRHFRLRAEPSDVSCRLHHAHISPFDDTEGMHPRILRCGIWPYYFPHVLPFIVFASCFLIIFLKLHCCVSLRHCFQPEDLFSSRSGLPFSGIMIVALLVCAVTRLSWLLRKRLSAAAIAGSHHKNEVLAKL